MDFALSEDQLELRQAARAWLADRFPLDRDWEAQDDRWAELRELGWLDVADAGLGFVEEALLLEEMGYVCYPGFYLGHVASLSGAGDAATVDAIRTLSHVDEETPRFRAACAAEALGVAQRALDLGVEHAKTREQFGKPIGTYQAVSHPLAQTYTDVELARSLVSWAAWCVAEEDERAELAAAAA
jgi:alkylation response protein AidB-like acyl-CoA dehydrogenase